MVDNITDIWVVGRSPEAERFYESVSGQSSRNLRCHKVGDGEEAFLKEEGCKACRFSAYYIFPSEGFDNLPSVFDIFSRYPRYDLYVCRTDLCRFEYLKERHTTVSGIEFARFRYRKMPVWQQGVKRAADMVLSVAGLLLSSPLFLLSIVLVKAGSPGPVFYAQERIGLHGRPYRIFKFRSMYRDAEKGKPELSRRGDVRITPWGQIMRKYRIDELPQLWNVLKGDMSFIGYRPEREFFIRQIWAEAPYYNLLMAVRPGISSLGITTFGYATTVGQMLVRLRCDMKYLQNISLKEDLRLLWRTLSVVVRGLGK